MLRKIWNVLRKLINFSPDLHPRSAERSDGTDFFASRSGRVRPRKRKA